MEQRERTAKLARQAIQGSQDAFNDLYHLTRDRAYFVAFSITRNEQDALDILQESYLKAWQRIGTLQKPEQFPAWLNQITGNTAKDYIKQRKPQLFQAGADDETDILDLQAEKTHAYIPDAAMDTEETRRLIMEIVDSLPDDQRLCTLMYYYDDMDVAGIAAALEVPYGTVQSRLNMARKKIGRGVEDLERKGTKLYSAAPVPLLIWMLRRTASETAANLPPVVLSGTAAAGTAASGILAGITLPKIIAGIAVAVVVGGGTAAGVVIARRSQAQPVLAETTITAIAQTEPESGYSLLLSDIPALPLPENETVLPSDSQSAASVQILPGHSSPAGTTARTAAQTAGTNQHSIPASTLAAATTTTTTKAITTTTTNRTTTTAAARATTTTRTTTTTKPTTTTTTTSTTTTTTTTQAPQKITKNSGGVTLEYMEGVLPENVTFTASSGGMGVLIQDGAEPVAGWNLSLSAQPNGTVTVHLPIPGTFTGNPAALTVFHSIDGTYVNTNATLSGNDMVFNTNQF